MQTAHKDSTLWQKECRDKRQYSTKKAAKESKDHTKAYKGRQRNSSKLDVYKCSFCGYWHVGHRVKGHAISRRCGCGELVVTMLDPVTEGHIKVDAHTVAPSERYFDASTGHVVHQCQTKVIEMRSLSVVRCKKCNSIMDNDPDGGLWCPTCAVEATDEKEIEAPASTKHNDRDLLDRLDQWRRDQRVHVGKVAGALGVNVPKYSLVQKGLVSLTDDQRKKAQELVQKPNVPDDWKMSPTLFRQPKPKKEDPPSEPVNKIADPVIEDDVVAEGQSGADEDLQVQLDPVTFTLPDKRMTDREKLRLLLPLAKGYIAMLEKELETQ